MRRYLQFLFGISALLLAAILWFVPILGVQEHDDGSVSFLRPIVAVAVLAFVGCGFLVKGMTNTDRAKKEMIDTFGDE